MMTERRKWIRILEQLWLRNFKISHYYRRAMEAVIDPALKKAFLKFASSKAQLAYELNQQIKRLKGKPANPEKGENTYSTPALSLHLAGESKEILLKKSMETESDTLDTYLGALSAINEGLLREILIRHRALIRSMLKELRSLQDLQGFSEVDRNFQTN